MTSRSGAVVRQLGFASAIVACIALPALVVGAGIDAAPMPGELERLRAAVDGTFGSRLAEQFERLTLPLAGAWPDDADQQMTLLGTARLAQVGGVLLLSMLVYLATLLARGRLAALAACVGLTCLPAIMVHGYVLRPETLATAFTALGLLLLQLMVTTVHGRASRGVKRRAIVLALLALSAATAIGLAVGAMPALGGGLQLPLVLAMLIALQVGLRGVRVGLRRGFLRLPAHATTSRIWAPALAMMAAFVMALWCLHASLTGSSDTVGATALASSMLPENGLARALLLALAGIGAVSFLARTGWRFGRRGRAGADLVLLLYVFTQLFYGLAATARFDPLPAAPALAILFGEGVLALVAFVAWLGWRARRKSTPGRVSAEPRR